MRPPSQSVMSPPSLEELGREIDSLSLMDLDDLRAYHRRLLRRQAPAHLKSSMLVRIIAYELQARAFGHLDPATEKFLNKISERIEKEQTAAAARGAIFRPDTKAICALAPAVTQPAKLLPGAVLVREFDGEDHRVTVVEEGFLWQGTIFSSLSEVAKAITGTSWSGPRFFGLLESQTRRQRARTSSIGDA